MSRDYRVTVWFKALDMGRQTRLAELLQGKGREMSVEEYSGVMPPRGPMGSDVNQVRGQINRELARRGFYIDGGF